MINQLHYAPRCIQCTKTQKKCQERFLQFQSKATAAFAVPPLKLSAGAGALFDGDFGGGVDYALTDALYLRGSAFYGVRLAGKEEKDGVAALKAPYRNGQERSTRNGQECNQPC